LPKRQAKVQRKNLQEFEDEDESEEEFDEDNESLTEEEDEDLDEEEEEEEQLAMENKKKNSKKQEEEELFGDEPKPRASRSPAVGKVEIGQKRQREKSKKVRFNTLDSESGHDTPLPNKRRTRANVNYSLIEKEEEAVAEVEEKYEPVQKKQKVDPEQAKKDREFNQKKQKILNNSKYGSRIEKLLGTRK